MGLNEWLFGKPLLYGSSSMRSPGLWTRMLRKLPLSSSLLYDKDYSMNVGAMLMGSPPTKPTVNGGQISRYGACIGGGFETITAVGDICLADLLGSDYDLYYVKENTFEDMPFESVWLVNRKNEYFVEAVIINIMGIIKVGKGTIQFGTSHRFLYLSDLNGKPWNSKLIREAGVNIPT